MPHKPRLHALGPIVFCLSAIYEYGVYTEEYLRFENIFFCQEIVIF